MITGAHSILYSADAEADRAFLRDVLGLPAVDAGGGWLIFGVPAAEVAVHPADPGGTQALWLMCDDLRTTVDELKSKGAEFSRDVSDQRWGVATAFRLPSGLELGLYEPRHPRP